MSRYDDVRNALERGKFEDEEDLNFVTDFLRQAKDREKELLALIWAAKASQERWWNAQNHGLYPELS